MISHVPVIALLLVFDSLVKTALTINDDKIKGKGMGHDHLQPLPKYFSFVAFSCFLNFHYVACRPKLSPSIIQFRVIV